MLPATPDPAFPAEAIKVFTDIAKTFISNDSEGYYNGIVIIRHIIKEQIKL
jgi:hypothetical protein